MNKLFLTTLFILSAGIASGHGLGQSFEQKAGNYLVDVGYSSPDNIETGDFTRFDFNLWKEDKSDVVDFDHVWVRIAPQGGRGANFAGFFYHPTPLSSGMSYKFEKAGTYELTVRFLDKDEANIAEATFSLEVISEGSFLSFLKFSSTILGVLAGLIIGAGAVYLMMHKNKS